MNQFNALLLIPLTLLLIFPFNTLAQPDVDVEWSKTVKLGMFARESPNFVGEMNDHFYLVSGMESSRTVQLNNEINFIKLNADLRIVEESEFKLEGPEGNRTHTATLIQDGKIYLFTRKKDDDKYYLYLETIDKSTLQPTGDRKQILKANGGSGFLSISTGEDFRFRSSPDSLKWLIGFVGGHKDKIFQYWVLDKSFNEIRGKGEIVANDFDFDVVDMGITNDGNAFMIVDESTTGGLFNKPEYKYTLYCFFEKGGSPSKYQFGKKNYEINKPKAVALENNTIGLAGFYRDIEKESNVGSFFISIDEKEQNIRTREYTSFGVDYLAFGNTSGEQRKIRRRFKKGNDIGLHPIWTRDVIRRGDGGLVVIGEEFRMYSNHNHNTSNSNAHYEFDDIYLVNYDPDGSIRWQNKIPKIQATSGGMVKSMSYTLATVDDQIHLLFNDNEKNVNFKGPGNPKTAVMGAAMLMATIDGSGTITRRIADDMDNNLYFLTTSSRKYGDNNIFLMSQKMGKYKFGKMDITNKLE